MEPFPPAGPNIPSAPSSTSTMKTASSKAHRTHLHKSSGSSKDSSMHTPHHSSSLKDYLKEKEKEHKEHQHHQHRRHHHHHHSRHARDASAQLSQTVSGMLKQAGGRGGKEINRRSGSMEGSMDSRGRGHGQKSSIGSSRERENTWNGNGSTTVRSTPRRLVVTAEDVEKERVKLGLREEELRTSLHALSDDSFKSSRRLDDTYYAVLEKVSMLRQTIGHLQEISALTRDLHATFNNDTKEVVEDVKTQLDIFGDFATQEEQVEKLEQRVRAGREKAQALNQRLQEARRRVEVRAKLEAEGEKRIRRRLKAVGATLGIIIGLIFVLILVQQLRPVQYAPDPRNALDTDTRASLQRSSIPEPVKEILLRKSTTSGGTRTAPPLPSFASSTSVPSEDPVIRIFDEL